MPPDSSVTPLINIGVDLARGLSLLVHMSKTVSLMGFSLYQWAWWWVVTVLAIKFYTAVQTRVARIFGDNSIIHWEQEVRDLEQEDRETFFDALMAGRDPEEEQYNFDERE